MRPGVVLLLALVAPAIGVACADRFVAASPKPAPDAGGDASALLPPDAASPRDASADAPAVSGCQDPPPLTLGSGEFLVQTDGCSQLTAPACGGALGARYIYQAGCLPRALFQSELGDLLDCELPVEGIVLSAKLGGTLETSTGFDPTGTLSLRGAFDLPAACKDQLSPGLGCGDLGTAAALVGFSGVTCCDNGTGDCHCVLDSSAPLTRYASYQLENANILASGKTFPYCVSGSQLQIGRNASTSSSSFVMEELVTWTLSRL